MFHQAWYFGLGAIALIACSEAVSDDDASSSDQTGPGGTTSGGVGGEAMGGGSSTSTNGGTGAVGNLDPGLEALVINEISASGDDYVELYNTSSQTIDIGGLQLADDDGGVPKLDAAVLIPADTTLEGGAYLFLLADQEDMAQPGFQTECDIGPSPCLQAAWGLSAGGDVVYLLDGGDNVIKTVEYPADATMDGESWSRLPNGTGDFSVGAPTPGDANAAL